MNTAASILVYKLCTQSIYATAINFPCSITLLKTKLVEINLTCKFTFDNIQPIDVFPFNPYFLVNEIRK